MERNTRCVDPEAGNRNPTVGLDRYTFRLNREVQYARLVRVIESAGYLIGHIGGRLHVEPAVMIEQVAERLRVFLVLGDAEVYPLLVFGNAGSLDIHVR